MIRTSHRAAPLVAAAAALAIGATAYAGPFDPPFRGEPNSVHAIFSWVDQGEPWSIDLFETGPNSNFPLDEIEPAGSDDGLNTFITCPNFVDPLPLKLVRIQLSFDGQIPLDLLDIQINAFDPQTTGVIETDRGGPSPTGAPTYYVDFQIRPNPDWEEIIIFGDTGANIVPGNLLTIEIDTISIPTPAAALPLAGLGLVASRRRR